jgi:AraC family transcriptional regulator
MLRGRDIVSTSRPPVATVPEPGVPPLSTDCRILSGLRPVERLLFAGESTCVGTFACRPDQPQFHTESPSTAHCLVFSRTPVWIRHERGTRYVADPTVATFHNRGRVYQRWRIVDRGDRCDWIAYADDLVADAVARVDRPRAGRDPRWFPADYVPISSALYARQRRFFNRAAAIGDERHGIDGLDDIDEEAILLLDLVLSAVQPDRRGPPRRAHAVDAIQHVRALIARAPTAAPSLRALAQQAEMSPFQLCRAFSQVCGETMTSYRLRLRLLASLERLRAGAALVEIALAHGFSSHSHYSAAFRLAFGITPTSWRKGATLRVS